MKQRVILRGDGNSSIGFGHVFRLLALGEHLKKDFDLLFLTIEPQEFIRSQIENTCKLISLNSSSAHSSLLSFIETNDIVVLDGYQFTNKQRKEIQLKAKKLVIIDDIPSRELFSADVIINHTPGITPDQYHVEENTKLFLGTDYAILRRSFLDGKRVRSGRPLKSVFITMGGADLKNVTLKAVHVASVIEGIEKINVLLNSSHPHRSEIAAIAEESKGKIRLHQNLNAEQVAQLILESDFGFLPASVSAYEACSLKLPMVAVLTADNQKYVFNFLKENNLAICIEDPDILDENSFSGKYLNFEKDPMLLEQMQHNQRKFFDGKSGERLKDLFKSLS